MKVQLNQSSKVRIELIPLIDIVFLLLVFFIYAMLSMAVHRGLPVQLPKSTATRIEKHTTLSVTVKADGSIFVDKEPVPLFGIGRCTESESRRQPSDRRAAVRRSRPQLSETLPGSGSNPINRPESDLASG